MNSLMTLTILTLTIFGCSNNKAPTDNNSPVTETEQQTKEAFRQLADFPMIKDTTKFIRDLRQLFNLEVHESPAQRESEKITAFKKVNLYGSGKDYYFIEYDWKVGSMAEFPWKYQLLLTKEGKLVKSLAVLRFDFVSIFPNQNPFLLTVIASAKGNGGHQLYKISADTLENVYEGYYDYAIRTYDAEQDLSVFEPNELKIEFVDENRDGFKDIVFTGQKLMLGKYTKDSLWYDVEKGKPFSVENPADRIPVKYVFPYDEQTGHFKAKDKYEFDN
jgi:hypothetical protein